MTGDRTDTARIASLDQFRGYTVLGMFLVNFVGPYAAIKAGFPLLCHHHTYCSYADTIMPQFFVAVGFAYRLTFLRRLQSSGMAAACRSAVWRNLGLLLLAAVIHRLDGSYDSWETLQETGVLGVLAAAFQRNYFQTLTHIGITALWIMPVVAARPSVRIVYALGSGVLFHLMSVWGYYDWVLARPGIDGGPLGFLTWTIPMIAGTLAYDVVTEATWRPAWRLFAMGTLLMLLSYALSCVPALTTTATTDAATWQSRLTEPPFVPPTRPVTIWTMSQRAGSVTYLTFGAGFSLAVLAVFVLACDIGRLQLGLFRTLGSNALAAYVLHFQVNQTIRPFVPNDGPTLYVFAAFGVSLLVCYTILRWMERRKLYLRL